MANTTFRAACERVLRLSGRNPFTDDAEFNAGNIDAEKAALKEFFSIANQRYGRVMRNRLMAREFSLSLVDNDNDYDLDATVSVDRLVPKSWYCTTAGSSGALTYYPGGYYQWKRDFPEGQTEEGAPRYWFYYPSTANNPDRIGFSPPPDGSYTVKYSAYLKPVLLTSATDLLIWPPEIEDGVVLAALTFLQMYQAEGKNPDIEKLLEPIFSEIKQVFNGPLDEIKYFDIGFHIDGFGIF